MKYFFLSLISCLIAFISCKSDATSTQSKEGLSLRKDISVEEAAKWLRTDKEVILIDVRTPEEYKEGYIQGATLIDFKDEYFEAGIDQLDPKASYLIYCRSGGRSSKATDMMISKGFKDVTNMKGGYLEWEERYVKE